MFEDIQHQQTVPSPRATANTKVYEEIYRHARLREAELLDIIKMLKNEVNSMRKRFSLIRTERQQQHHLQHPSSSSLSSSTHNMTPHTPKKSMAGRSFTASDTAISQSNPASGASVPMTTQDLEYEGDHESVASYKEDMDMDANNSMMTYDPEQEARLQYLKQAFSGFFRAKNAVEMQHLGRVICAILGVPIEEQAEILDGITKLSPAVVATSTIDSITQQIASIFS